MSQVRLPLGVRDRSLEHARAVAMHGAAIARAFDLAGYELVDPAPFELFDVIERGLGESARKTAFLSVDPATGEVVALRPDFTAQIARLVVTRMGERPRPLRLRYQGRVFRTLDPHGRGLRSRDVHQSGLELIGAPETSADVEVIATGIRALAHLGAPLLLDLGHAAIVEAMTPKDVDKRAVHEALLVRDLSRVEALAPTLAPLLDLYGKVDVLATARKILGHAPDEVHRALEALEHIARGLVSLLPSVAISIDLGEVRGLGYYSGPFFAGYVRGAADAVLMGGRYDGLLARYGGHEPAVGLAIDVDALARAEGSRIARVGVVLAETDTNRERLDREAETIRTREERAVLIPADRALAYAVANGYRVVLELRADGRFEERVVHDDADR